MPLDEAGQTVAPGDFETQAIRAVENLIAALTSAGADRDDLVRTTIYVASSDRTDLVRVWQAMESALGRAPSTLVGVAVLGYPGQLVEVEAVARARR